MKQKVLNKFWLRVSLVAALLTTAVTTAMADATQIAAWSRSGSKDSYTSGWTFKGTGSTGATYYQDNSGTTGLKLYRASETILSTTPGTITLTATIGGGSNTRQLTSSVYVCYVDASGNAIEGTEVQVTKYITTAAGDTYNISLDASKATTSYGIYVYHTKESGYNVRYYSISISYEAASTPHTVILADDETELTEESAGAGVTLPTRTAIGGYTFAGWSTTNCGDEETTTAPTIIPAGAYSPTEDVTLYPVYTRSEQTSAAHSETASVTISDYAAANNWSDGTAYQPLTMDNYISVGGTVSGNNFKYYTSDNSWRFYSGGSFTVTATNATINTITLTYSAGTLSYNSTSVTSGTAVTVNATSATFSASATTKITAISVTYEVPAVTATYYISTVDTRTPVVTDLDLPAAQKTLAVGDTNDFAPTANVASDFTGTVTYSYETSDATVVDVAGSTFSAEGVGTATITITATPTGGNAESYRAITQDVVVAVKGVTTLSVSGNSSLTYGSTGTLTATVANGYDGTLTAESDNTSVATVAVSGTTITVTGQAVGSATITVTAPATDLFNGEVSQDVEVVFGMPEGQGTAAPGSTTIWTESWSQTNGTGGNDDSWSGSIAQGTISSDLTGWTYANEGGASGCVKLGSSSKKGSATTPAFGQAGNFTVSFKAGAWNGSDEQTELMLSLTGDGTLSASSVVMTKGAFTEYSVTVTGATANTKLKFEGKNASNSRFFLDDVTLATAGTIITATLNAKGYATFCSEYPLDFTDAESNGYSAWQITDIDGENNITFQQVTGTVKGGTGLFLKGTAGATITLTSADSDNELSGNLLEGTLAPTYVEADKYYGLSGENFVKVNAGTVKKGKALLDKVWITASVGAKPFTFIFGDDATGIRTIETVSAEEAAQIFNLAGQRISRVQKGINIVNGKKVLY